jgi:hypothetical protein
VQQGLSLLRKRLANSRMGMPQIAYRNSGDKIGVGSPIGIPELGPIPFNKDHWKSLIGIRHHLIGALH